MDGIGAVCSTKEEGSGIFQPRGIYLTLLLKPRRETVIFFILEIGPFTYSMN